MYIYRNMQQLAFCGRLHVYFVIDFIIEVLEKMICIQELIH